ncbi:hybrid sensor histidine kinase/response regulator [Marinicellulosiphila megalodicopiae]|uniref:hybrid sensor histidine kinase/response regulator n=1 Tax=Marinicellulosiphila megalodicopiae TaxID=2724896 RepID=UPI003BAFD4C1
MKNIIRFLAFIIISFNTANASVVTLKDDKNGINVTSYLDVLIDESGYFNEFNVLYDRNFNLWNSIKHNAINYGYSDKTYWFKIKLDASESKSKKWDLIFSNSLLSTLDIYKVTENGPRLIYRSGSNRAFANREVDHHKMIVPVDLYEPSTLLIKIQTELDFSLNIKAWPDNQFWQSLQFADNMNWLYFGLIATMVIYNLFLYLSVNDRSYLIYVFFIGSYGAYIMTIDGYVFHLFWPKQLAFDSNMAHFSAAIMITTGFLFCLSFLRLRQYSTHLFWLCQFSVVISLINIPAIFFLSPQLLSKIMIVQSILAMAIAILCSAVCTIKGYRPAIFFLLGWVALFVGNLLLLMTKTGLISTLDASTTLISKIGSSCEALFLSFALAHRIRVLKSQSEEVHLKSEARKQFLAKMSHEIRTPLNGILGIAELLKNSKLNSEQKTYVQTIKDSGTSLLSLINDILDHSKIESGKLELENTTYNLKLIIEQCKNTFLHEANRKNIQLISNIDPNIPDYLLGDSNRLRQVIINLLGNAFKFSDHGKIEVNVQLIRSKAPLLLKFEIIDQGIGIPEHIQQTLFEEYQQADSSTSRKYGGTGLGLTICKQLVELMDGTIGIFSKPDKGSTFWFTISAQTSQSVDTNKDPIEITQYESGLNILIAEDNCVNQMVIKGLLTRENHNTTMTANGEEVVDAFKNNPGKFDLILMDCEMPITDGFEATRKIRSLEKQNNLTETKIFALTAHATNEHRALAIECGMDDFLIKPIAIEKLRSALSNAHCSTKKPTITA